LQAGRGGDARAANPEAWTLFGVTLSATDVPVSGTLRVGAGLAALTVRPEQVSLDLRPGAADTTVAFAMRSSGSDGARSAGVFRVPATFEAKGRTYDTRIVDLDYPHVPMQVVELPAVLPLVAPVAGIRCTAHNVGYLMGSGDAGPDVLRELGAPVTLLEDGDVETSDLSRFDVIVVGVRAYNTRPRLRALQPRLMEYVNGGGRLVVQYQTADNALVNRIGPYPFTISRDRVTVEGAQMRFLAPEHPLLTTPNRIGPADCEGWVQERGLYYANPWDAKYDAVLSANDPGEPPRDGGLLFARYGKGQFIYTGLALFRQLPAGVPGAWRLFANLVSPER
jgi:hypothetical protein